MIEQLFILLAFKNLGSFKVCEKVLNQLLTARNSLQFILINDVNDVEFIHVKCCACNSICTHHMSVLRMFPQFNLAKAIVKPHQVLAN